MGKKDIYWINAVKAISILAVFFVHCELFVKQNIPHVNPYIKPFYVNAFFFVSGYLMFRKQLSLPAIKESVSGFITGGGKKMLQNIGFRIAVPSMIFATIEFLPKKLIRGEGFQLADFLWETVGGRTYWFTSALIVAQLIVLVLLITRNRNVWLYWFVSLLITMLGFRYREFAGNIFGLSEDPWHIKNALLSVSLLTAGGLYWKYEKQIQRFFVKPMFFTLLLVYILLFTFFDDHFRYVISLLQLNWAGYLGSCLASMLLIEICRMTPQSRFLTYVGQNSLCFYFMSGALPNLTSIVMFKVMGTATWYGTLMIWIVCIVLAYFATRLINRYIPWILDLRVLSSKYKPSSGDYISK